MIYYTAGQYETETNHGAWFVFARDGETGAVIRDIGGPMTEEEALQAAEKMNRAEGSYVNQD